MDNGEFSEFIDTETAHVTFGTGEATGPGGEVRAALVVTQRHPELRI